jgi:hypothetical protein
MNHLDRSAVAGALAAVLLPGTLLLAAPSAHADSASAPSKAQVEHLERLQADSAPPPIAPSRDRALAGCLGHNPSKAQIEHCERLAQQREPQVPAEQPIEAKRNGAVPGWQLALGALAGAGAAGGIAAGARRSRRQQPRAPR